jgi:hypothetical protein
MTTEDFRRSIKRSDKVDDIVNYVLAICFLIAGIYFLLKITNAELHGNNEIEKLLPYLAPLFLICTAMYVIWRIPKDYIVYEFNSPKSVEEKQKIIDNYLSDVKLTSRIVNGSLVSYQYRNKFLSSVKLKVYLDAEKILFNAQAADMGSKGVIDFGLTRRAAKRLYNYLEANL